MLRTRGIWQRVLLPRLKIASFVWRAASTAPVFVGLMVGSREGSTGIRYVLSGRRVLFSACSRWGPATLEGLFCRRFFVGQLSYATVESVGEHSRLFCCAERLAQR